MNPNIRTVTDLTTIPLSVAQVGTLTPVVGNVELLEYSGTASALDAILVQAGANKDQQKIDLWVWDGTQTAPFNITAWFGKFVKINGDASAYTGDFNLIESKLFGWEVISTGDGTGTVSGSAIGALNTITFKPVTDFFVDPVVVEGNVGDNLTVLEFYNQQAGNGIDNGGENYIEVDKVGFLALVAANALTFPATYKVTDIDNGLFVETLSENTFDTDGTLFSLQPSYIVSGVYKGQLLPTDSVSIGDIWVYGNHFWESVTGVNSTPIDFLNLDLTDWAKVPKSEANGYINIQFIAQVGIYGGDLYITKLQNSATRDDIDVSSYFASLGADGLVKSWVVIGENSEFASSSNNGSIVNNRFNDVLFAYNISPNSFPNIPFIYNVDGALGELAGNINYSNSSIHDGVFNGADCLIARNLMINSEIKNFNLAGNGVIRISSLNNSIIDNVVITQLSGKLGLSDLYLYESTISNVTDINITQSSFHDIDINFTGFSVDVYGVNIINGRGWFVITHDFAANPLNSGSAVLYNIIPTGAKVTDIKAFGSATGGVGATLAFGIDTDAPSLIPAAVLATVNAGQIYNLLSATATANRSLAITAGVANVTGGSVTVLVEFMV